MNTDVTKMGMHLQKVREMLWFSIESSVGQGDRKSTEQEYEKELFFVLRV